MARIGLMNNMGFQTLTPAEVYRHVEAFHPCDATLDIIDLDQRCLVGALPICAKLAMIAV